MRGKGHGEEGWQLSVLEDLKAASLGCIWVFRYIWGCSLSAFAVLDLAVRDFLYKGWLGTFFVGLGRAELMLGLDLRGLFPPQ